MREQLPPPRVHPDVPPPFPSHFPPSLCSQSQRKPGNSRADRMDGLLLLVQEYFWESGNVPTAPGL